MDIITGLGILFPIVGDPIGNAYGISNQYLKFQFEQ